jgi:ABC-2 type transport system ATP-binding protein
VQVEENRLLAPCDGGARVLTAVLRQLDDMGVEVQDVGLRRPTLDDVFLTLTGRHAEEAAEDTESGEADR